MQFLNNLINKVGLFVVFILLEVAALFFTATRSDFHKNAIGYKAMAVKGYFTEKYNYVTRFIHLPEENELLTEENARLKATINQYTTSLSETNNVSLFSIDSSLNQTYTYTPAKIVDYSIAKKDNYFIINKGSKDGIKENMGVLSPKGIVGVVLGTGNHYSSVLSVLHSKSLVKARVKGNSRFGIIRWDGEDVRELSLTEIPKYINISIGDTVITAGASATYPEGELIGQISELAPNNQTGDYEITVKMFNNLTELRNVYVVENLDRLDIQNAKAPIDAITE